MLPVPPSSPPSSTSTDNEYVDMSNLSTQIESLGLRLTSIIGNSTSSNPDKNVEKKPTKPKPRMFIRSRLLVFS